MKPDYKNWMPKGMVLGFLCGAVICLILFIIFGLSPVLPQGILKMILFIVFLLLTVILTDVTIWMYLMYRAFSYNGKRQMSRTIIEGTAEYITIPKGGKGLDVGCGSGALTIAAAKKNPDAQIIGIDRWGKEYASFSKSLCESNAKAENDESFDAVMSNYVYHNIPSKDRQTILIETLRVLKKGGCFAIHDIMSQSKYGNMQSFVEKLKSMGYESVELIDTTDGKFMSPFEAKWMALSGSAILVGRK